MPRKMRGVDFIRDVILAFGGPRQVDWLGRASAFVSIEFRLTKQSILNHAGGRYFELGLESTEFMPETFAWGLAGTL